MRLYVIPIVMMFYQLFGVILLAVVSCAGVASLRGRWKISFRHVVACVLVSVLGSLFLILGPQHQTEHILKALVIGHIAIGFGLLGSGLLAIVARKGGWLHVWSGRCYFWLMAITTVNALLLALIHLNPFGMFFSVTTFYLVYTAYRIMPLAGGALKIHPFDGVFFVAALMACAGLIAFAVVRYLGIQFTRNPNEAMRAAIFGGVSGCFIVYDFASFRGKTEFSRLRQHVLRMLAAYAVTASTASVVLLKFMNREVAALWPYAVLVPVGVFFLRRMPAGGKTKILTE